MSKTEYISVGEKFYFDVQDPGSTHSKKTTITGRITAVGEGGFWFELIGQKHIKFNNDNLGDDFKYAGEKFKWSRIIKGRRVFMEWIPLKTRGESPCKEARDLMQEAIDAGCETSEEFAKFIGEREAEENAKGD